MNRQELKEILLANVKPVEGVNFADAQKAAINGMVEFSGLEEMTPREIKSNRPMLMALIEEVIDEVLPQQLEDRIGDFAEVKSFGRDDEVVFVMKGRGKRRAFMTIKKGQRGGMYQAARLDDTNMSLPTWTETVGVFVTLEEILLGKQSLADLMNNILDGFVERMYTQVIEALKTASSEAPAANRASAAGMDTDELDDIIRVVSAYGSPVIMGFRRAISKITNTQGNTNPNIPASDLDERKNRGYVGVYQGVPIVALPNYIVDENTNAEWLLGEEDIFILPANVKPVKVALKGDLHIQPYTHPTGSMEENAHKMLGVGVLLYNNIGIYTDTDLQ